MRFVLSILFLVGSLSCLGISADTIPGYSEKVFGEDISYFSPLHRFADAALLTRANGVMPIRWTAQTYSGNTNRVVFELLVGHSTGTSGGERKFDVLLNGRLLFTITTPPKQQGHFLLNGGDPDSCSYRFVSLEYDQNGDAFGNLYLTVPASMVRNQVEFSIVGRDQQSRDWLMVFKHRAALRIQVQPTVLVTRAENKRQLNIYAEFPFSGESDFTLNSTHFTYHGKLKKGYNTLNIPAYHPSVLGRDSLTFEFGTIDTIVRATVDLSPIRNFRFHIIHHSHNDIGYSHLQQEVERIQNENIRSALRWVKSYAASKENPVWHIESLWAVENFLGTASVEEERLFVEAVRKGSIVLSANYANVLTGLCRPEEQAWNTEYARRLEKKYGFKIQSAMITDIPGITYDALKSYALNGIRYLSLGPNYVETQPDHGDRVGGVIREQGDVAFYWRADSTSEKKVLVWTAGKGYSYFHNITAAEMQPAWEDRLSRYCNELYEKKYPFDIVQLRYTKKADNGPVDTSLCDFVTDWNRKFSSPQLLISDVNALFQELEENYGDLLPVVSGEISPYWEDGAYSTAKEELQNRELSAKTIALERFAVSVGKRELYDQDFYRLHRNILLFHEHTWGAWCSISDPELPFTTQQWEYKKSFLDSAQSGFHRLLIALNYHELESVQPTPQKKIADFTVDPVHGGLKSILVDGRNIVSDSSSCSFFEMIYALGVDSTRLFLPDDLKLLGYRDDKKRKQLSVSFTLKNCGRVQVDYYLDKATGVLSAKVHVDKVKTNEKESLHMALPFNMDHPQLRYGADDLLTFGVDQLPGSNKDFICVPERMEVSDSRMKITVHSRGANLFEVGGMIDESRISGAKKWKSENHHTAELYLYLLNNYWHTNYKASQEGRVEFTILLSAD